MKYKILLSTLLILFAFLLTSGTAFAADFTENPVRIETLQDLMDINNPAHLGKNYTLINNINIGSEEIGTLEFTPIGTDADPFTGEFDGQGFTISNITFTDATMNGVGLFGVTDSALISNLKLREIDLTGKDYVGGLIGLAKDTVVTYCSIENSANFDITGNNSVGGLIGRTTMDSEISNSYAASNVEGNYAAGGFVGYMFDSSEISESYANGRVKGVDGVVLSSSNVGGFVGYMLGSSKIFDSFAIGNVEGNRTVGGFVGSMRGTSSIVDSYATGNANSNSDAGGFAAIIYDDSSISRSYSSGNVKGQWAGGFVGTMNDDSSIEDSYATGNANGLDKDAGGFVSYMNQDSSITGSYATGNANGDGIVGGFAGEIIFSIGTPVITDSFYIGAPNSNNNDKGFFVTSAKLKQIETFELNGGYVSISWDISSSPDQASIWYINEGNGYPKFEWYEPQKGGPGTGGATVVDNIPTQNAPIENIPVVNNTPQNIIPPQNNSPIQENTVESKTATFQWLLLLIGALLLIFILFIFLYKR